MKLAVKISRRLTTFVMRFHAILIFMHLCNVVWPFYALRQNLALLRRTTCSQGRLTGSCNFTQLQGKIAKIEEGKNSAVNFDNNDRDGGVNIPYAGLIGYEANNLFYQPIDINDPLKDTSDLPGEDGSDEKIAAIQQRIQNRVESLKLEGNWENEADQYGKDPLATQPIWITMMMQLKACRPFETWDELALTYTLVILTTAVLAGYIILVSDTLKSTLDWYVQTDFNAELFNNIVASVGKQISSILSSASSWSFVPK